MGSLSCPLCCGRLFKNRQALKNRLLTWKNGISCPVCLWKFNTTTEFAHHLDDESCKKVVPRPRPKSGPSSTVSTSPEESIQVNVSSSTGSRMPYEAIISVDIEENMEVTRCEQDGDEQVEQLDRRENNTEQFQHFCLSCNCPIQGIREHINDFHRDEMVVLKMAEDEEDCSYIEEVKQYLSSISNEKDNIEFLPDMSTFEEQTNNSVVDKMPKALHCESKKTHSIVNKNDECTFLGIPRLLKSNPKLDQVMCIATKNSLLNVSNKQEESKKLAPSNEIPYVSKIIHTEKFWEKQFWEKQSQKALLSVQEKKKQSMHISKTEIMSGNSLNLACEQDNPKQLHDAAKEQEAITVAESILVNETNVNLNSLAKQNKCIRPRGLTFCEVCNIKFKSNRSLLSHIKSHDPNTKKTELFQKQCQKLLTEPAVCDICNTEFTKHVNLRIHMKMHRPEHSRKESKNLTCDVCNMVCYTEHGFRVHYRIHTRDKQTVLNVDNTVTTPLVPLLKCELCNVAFFSNEELKAHWQSHSLEAVEEQSIFVVTEETVVDECVENEEDFFTCGICDKRIGCLLREDHEKMHLVESRFGCSICNKQFTCETDLSFHIAMHKSAAVYECHQCKLTFLNAVLLKGHIKKIHSGSYGKKRPYPCRFCERRFIKPFEKVDHERVHTGEKPFECRVCGMKFRVRSCLRLHDRIHTGVRPYSCDQCGKRFRALCNYKQHVRLHSDVRPFACPICSKAFKTSVALAAHKAVHFKRYACPKCGRRFAVMHDMRAHLNLHSSNNDLKHKCHICGATYIRKYALRDHILTHGANVIPPTEEEVSNYNYSEELEDVIC